TFGAAQFAGLVVVIVGGAVALWCVLAFATLGRGTPAPFDPPRRLVVRGPYRLVRNPMYLGAAVALLGAALYYESLALLAFVASVERQCSSSMGGDDNEKHVLLDRCESRNRGCSG